MPGHLQEGFGCAVTNQFDQLFDDESDSFEVLKAAENKKKEAGGGGVGGPGTKRVAQAAAQTNSNAGANSCIKSPRRTGEGKAIERRSERRPPRERRFEKSLEKGEGGEFSVDRPIIEQPIGGRDGLERGRGGRGCGMGRGNGFDSRGKREFDRHSGSDKSSFSHYSGLKHEDKHRGSRSHNWGTVKDELTDLDQSNVTEETPEGEEHPVTDTENKENEVEKVKEEGPKEMTLNEWKAIQNKDRAKVEFNIQKPNEDAD
ncbi:plasminogen activator inhibitor 1 RNA-binding protein isoform X3 [Sigmodon hispidus]